MLSRMWNVLCDDVQMKDELKTRIEQVLADEPAVSDDTVTTVSATDVSKTEHVSKTEPDGRL